MILFPAKEVSIERPSRNTYTVYLFSDGAYSLLKKIRACLEVVGLNDGTRASVVLLSDWFEENHGYGWH